MTTAVCNYKLWCATDSKWEYVWSTIVPTACPTNAVHTIDTDSIVVIEEVNATEIRVNEESTKTGGHFCVRGFNWTIPGSVGTYTFDESWPYPISFLAFKLQPETEHIGDVVSITIAPNTTVGAITSAVTAGDTTFNVSSTVLDYIKLGYCPHLYDGINTNNLGYVIAIDTVNSTVTTTVAAANNFAAETPTHFQMSVPTVQGFIVNSVNAFFPMGESKIGGSYLPANTVARVSITNTNGTAKNYVSSLEFLY